MTLTQTIPCLLIAMLALAVGCEPDFDYLDIEQRSAPPGTVYLEEEPLVLQEGLAVLVEVAPVSGNWNDYEDEDRVRLSSKNPNIFNVMPALEDRQFVLVGVSPGATCVEVRIHNRVEACIDVKVSEMWTGQ